MELTKENKEFIDSRTIRQLLAKWRFGPAGDPWFQGETGVYWSDRMSYLRKQDNQSYVNASKSLGWELK